MINKKQFLIVILLVITFIISNTALASMKVIHEEDIEYDISPDRITKDSYMPLNEISDELDIEFETLSNDRVIMMYDKYLYVMTADETFVKSNRGNFYLDNPILKINGHILLPVELLVDYLDVRIITRKPDYPEDDYKKRNIVANIFLEDDEYEEYEDLGVVIEIVNLSNQEQVLEFTSSQKYEIYIRNSRGNVIYTWSKNKSFTQAFQKVKLDPNDFKNYYEEIDLRGFREGVYYIEAVILANNFKINTGIKRFYIED
mgnify:FL=1